MSDDLTDDLTAEQAFDNSDQHSYNGKPLFGFGFSRQMAAIEMGLKFWRLNPSDLHQVWREVEKSEENPDGRLTTEIYTGLVMDTAIVLWLCSISDDEARAARRQPHKFEKQVEDFAESNGIRLYSPTLWQAQDEFFKIINEIRVSNAIPDTGAPPPPGN